MISRVLQGINAQLNRYIRSVDPEIQSTDLDPAILGNISMFQSENSTDNELDRKIVITLVNLTEEASLKNKPSVRVQNGNFFQDHPSVHLNLSLLFTATYPDYDYAIDQLFHVIAFFQGNKVFKVKNIPHIDPLSSEVNQMEFTFDLHTLSFEQINDLWGSLGGKQMPFVLYRVRLYPVQIYIPHNRSGIVSEIDLSVQHND